MGQEIGSVAVIGLGRIGLPLAAAFAGAGLRVVGVDRDPVLEVGPIPELDEGRVGNVDLALLGRRLEVEGPRIVGDENRQRIALLLLGRLLGGDATADAREHRERQAHRNQHRQAAGQPEGPPALARPFRRLREGAAGKLHPGNDRAAQDQSGQPLREG